MPPIRNRLPRRLGQLYLGLVLYGVGMALMLRSRLGNMPWDVLHQGLARHLGMSIGTTTVCLGASSPAWRAGSTSARRSVPGRVTG